LSTVGPSRADKEHIVKEVIEFALDDDRTIPVEVEQTGYDWTKISARGGRLGRDDKGMPRSFSDALERVRPMAEQLVDRLRDMAAEPETIEVEFGIKLSGAVGALIASTSTEANFTVKLGWKNKPAPKMVEEAG
jgi:hypothetical protein